MDVQGEKLSSDQAGALTFKADFANMIDIEKYNRDDIYNADKTGINWRALPRCSLTSCQETSAPGFKVSKERSTAMVCANASGSSSIETLNDR